MAKFPNPGSPPMIPRTDQRYRTFAGGLNTLDDPTEVEPTEVTACSNVDFYDGRVEKRSGTEQKGNTIGTATEILGLHSFRRSGANKLIAVYDTNAYYDDSGTWTSIKSGLTTDLDMAMETFTGYTYFTNGTDTCFKWDGTTVSDVSDMPKGTMLAVYRNMLVTAGETSNEYRFYYSNIGDGDTWDEGTDYVDVRTGKEKEPITALGIVNDRLVIFKERSVHMWDETQRVQIASGIGVESPRAVVSTGNELIFWGKDNVYVTTGSRVVAIGDKIQPTIQALNRDRFTEIASGYYKDDVYFAVTESGETTNTQIFIYNIPLKSWRVYDGLEASCFVEHDDEFYFGDDTTGKVWKMHQGLNDDDGGDDTAIAAYMEKQFDLTKFERYKKVKKFFVNLLEQGDYNLYFKYEWDQAGFNTEYVNMYNDADTFPYTFPMTFAGEDILGKVIRPQDKGHILRVRMGNDNADETFTIYDFSIHYKTKTSIK